MITEAKVVAKGFNALAQALTTRGVMESALYPTSRLPRGSAASYRTGDSKKKAFRKASKASRKQNRKR